MLSLDWGKDAKARWVGSKRRLELPNGAVALAFSSEDPESLRGPQFEIAWCDELAKWRYAEATWDMLQFGLRLGERPRQVVTTTPRPIPLVKRLIADPDTVTTQGAHDREPREPGEGVPDARSSRATRARGSGGRSSTRS